MLFLGYLYECGRGVPRDHAEAMKWYLAAGGQNPNETSDSSKAAPTPKELMECLELLEIKNWYLNAAELGDLDAQDTVGFAYKTGFFVLKNEGEAVKWLQRAAERGFGNAQRHLADCYAEGSGVAQDHAVAARWYRLAAEQGDHGAQFDLGGCYLKGQGVPQDEIEAYAWFSIATGQSEGVSTETRDHLAARLSPEALAQAEARVATLHDELEARKKALTAPTPASSRRLP
jgi:TPR repeat protein